MLRYCALTLAVICLSLPRGAGAATEGEPGPELAAELNFLAPLAGSVWIGHYADEETAHITHRVEWHSILGGKAVRATKLVGELDFEMETLYYFDPSSGAVVFVSVTNRGQLSRGTVESEDGLVVLSGEQLEGPEPMPYRLTYRVLPDGTLEDRFYRRKDGEWAQGHLIVHFASQGDQDPGE